MFSFILTTCSFWDSSCMLKLFMLSSEAFNFFSFVHSLFICTKFWIISLPLYSSLQFFFSSTTFNDYFYPYIEFLSSTNMLFVSKNSVSFEWFLISYLFLWFCVFLSLNILYSITDNFNIWSSWGSESVFICAKCYARVLGWSLIVSQ